MFDGNHRSRRAVNLGSSSAARRRQQQQQQRSARNSLASTTTSTTTTTTTNNVLQSAISPVEITTKKSSVLEETKRRREERRIQQQRVQAATNIQRMYRGWRTRQHVTRTVEEKLNHYAILQQQQQQQQQQSLDLLEFTFLLNVRFMLTQQEESLSTSPKKDACGGRMTDVQTTTTTWLNQYADAIILQQQATPQNNNNNNSATTPAPYTAHRIVRKTITYLQQNQLAQEKCLAILSYIGGLSTSTSNHNNNDSREQATNTTTTTNSTVTNTNDIRWKRLGGGTSFLQLAQAYHQLGIPTLLSFLQQVVPQTVMGRAFQGSLALTTMSPSSSFTVALPNTTIHDNNLSFASTVIPLLPILEKEQPEENATTKKQKTQVSTSFHFTDFKDNGLSDKMQIDGETSTTDDDDSDNEKLLTQAVQSMVSQSSVAILNNALNLYNHEIQSLQQGGNKETIFQYTAVMVHLVKYVLLSPSTTTTTTATATATGSGGTTTTTTTISDRDRTLLAVVTGMIVRGDDIASLKKKMNAMEEDTSRRDMTTEHSDESDDDDEDVPTNTTTTTTTTTNTNNSNNNSNTTTTAAAAGSTSVAFYSGIGHNKKHKSEKTSKTQKSSSNARLTKQELQTVSKLDRLYAQQVRSHTETASTLCQQQQQQQQLTDHLEQLAKSLANPSVFLQWGRILFESQSHATDDVYAARDAFVIVLAALLQMTTGLRSRQNYTSPFLTKLAFAPDFLRSLWTYIVNSQERKAAEAFNQPFLHISTYLSMSVFCDLFAHYLIATKDDQFLQHHTGPNAVVPAASVIAHIRDLLYELYWTKPVKASDFTCFLPSSLSLPEGQEQLVHASRARLFLTGTKLWNSLYERWNRLVRHESDHHVVVVPAGGSRTAVQHVICDESAWWFPTMTSALSSGENAVLINPVSNNRRSNDEDDAMSVDSADSDSSSDGSENGRPNQNNDQPMSVADAEGEALADTFSDPKMARILTCIPQAIPFDRRVKLFDSLLRADKRKAETDEESAMHQAMLAMMRGEQNGDFMAQGRERVEIRRDNLYSDSMDQLDRLGQKLKRRIQVTFINQHGAQEAGIDGGGVFKEFIDDLIKDAFSLENEKNSTASHHLFTVTPLQTLKVNTDIFHSRKEVEELLPHYEFLGRVLGKAVYESILVEPQFCLPFLNQLLGKNNSMEDLKNFDLEYYRNLTKLLQLSEAELESLGLTFELTLGSTGTSSHRASAQKTRTIELLPGGSRKTVTKENVIQYIHLVAHQRLNVETALPTRAFLRGFRDLIPASWVRLFSASELQKLISGDDSVKGIDVQSLKNTMQYAAGYHPSQPVVQWFWEIVDEMTVEQQHKFLKFMTSCSRQPLLGFGSLEPAPCIQQIRLPDTMFLQDEEMVMRQAPLPTSSTCMNLLKLPNYRWKELMRKKLLAAIESGAGFELT